MTDTSADTATGVDLGRRLAPGTLLASRYRILAQVGVGGMGVVYRAHDEELGIDVAVKVLRPDLGESPQWLERFRREIILAREVTHPNVVRIHDIGESEGLRFLTMRYVGGRSLLDVLQANGPLPLERALRIVRQLAAALQQAHAAGVVHRDLKPANVLLDADDTALITDFGIARSLDQGGPTRAGAVVGTPDYLSPEQVSGDPVDGRSDLYALGILFHEMLTGELPFTGESHVERVAQRLSGRPRAFRGEGRARAPAWVQAVIRRCLERSPARRYPTGADLLADLDRRRAPGRATRALRLGLPLALLVALAVWGGLRHRAGLPFLPRPTPGATASDRPAARHSVAVLPLSDETADPALAWVGPGAAEMLAARLSESAELRVIEPIRVFRTLHDLKRAGDRLDERTLQRLAELLNADTLVTGSVRRAGPTLRVDLRLAFVDAAGIARGASLGDESPEAGGLFRLVTDLGERLRSELGGRRGAGSEGTDLPETASLEAARAFREGRDRVVVGDHLSAAPAFERALAADPDYAAALEGLSDAYQHLGYHEKALAAAERAARLLEGKTTRLAYRVRARQALLRGDPAAAEGIYLELTRRYPNDADTLVELAGAQGAKGDLGRAVETLKRAAALDPSDPRAWFLLGKNAILAGDSGRAVGDYLLHCLTLQTRLRNEQGQGDVLNAMGAAHHQLGDYAQAVEKLSAAAQIRERLGDRRGLAVTLKNRARTHLATSHFAEAEADLKAARRIHEAIGDRAGRADVINDLGALREARGVYSEALKDYQEALRIRRDLGDESQLAQSYGNVGYIFYVQGEYDHALVYWKQALELHRKGGDKAGLVFSTQNLGFLQMAQGRWAEAFRSFAEALEASREIEARGAMAVSLGNMGTLHRHEGRYGAALASLQEALALLGALEDKRGLTEFTLEEAETLLELGRLDEAKIRLDAADGWLRETSNLEQRADHAALLGEYHVRRGEAAAARRAFDEAIRRARESRGRPALLRARIAKGAGLTALGDPEAGVALLAPAAREAEAVGDALLQILAGEALTRAELSRRRSVPAEEAVRKALALAERSGWYTGLYRLHALLGRVLEARGDAGGAAHAYAESARRAAQVREGLEADLQRAFDALPAVREAQERASGRRPSGGG